jgi:hypothetical protein
MYLLLEHQDIHDVMMISDDDELVEVKTSSSSTCSSSHENSNHHHHHHAAVPRPCTKRQRLLVEDGEPQQQRRRIRFVPEKDNLCHEIPTRQELFEEHGVGLWDQLYYQPEDLRELKRQAYLEVRLVELTYTDDDCTENYFFHDIVVVDAKELQRLRIFLDHPPPVAENGLTCCLRGLEKRSSRFNNNNWAGGSNTSKKKLRAKGLATVLMGQERVQEQRTSGTWRNWIHQETAPTMTLDEIDSQMDVVAQLYKDVTMPSAKAAQERAAYDELEARAIYQSSEVMMAQ